MNREDIEKLLGGYATGTLTPEEREALFAAAIEDQQLFETLAREEPLRELLQDPIAKTRLLAALDQRPQPWYRRWLRPAVWAIPAAGLAAIIVVLIVQRPTNREPVTIAQVLQTTRTEPAVPVPSPLPQVLEKRPFPARAHLVESRPAQGTAAPSQASAGPPPAPPTPPPPPAALPATELKELQVQEDAAAVLTQQGQQGQVIVVPPRAAAQPQARARQAAEGIRIQAAAGQLGGVAGFAPQADARALYYGAPLPPVFQTNIVRRETPPAAPAVANAPAPNALQHLGLRYSILRRSANGQTEMVNPNEPVDPNAGVSLRIEPNDAGYLYVFERSGDEWRMFASSRVERMAQYSVPQTGALSFDGSGPKELFVVFSRQPQQTTYPVPEARLDQLLSGNVTEGVTYVVSTSTVVPAQILAFPITLTQK